MAVYLLADVGKTKCPTKFSLQILRADVRIRNHAAVISDNPSVISRHRFGARERAPVDRIFPLEHLPPRLINHKYTVLLVYDLEVDSISYLCYKKPFGEHCLRPVQIADRETTRGEKNRLKIDRIPEKGYHIRSVSRTPVPVHHNHGRFQSAEAERLGNTDVEKPPCNSFRLSL